MEKQELKNLFKQIKSENTKTSMEQFESFSLPKQVETLLYERFSDYLENQPLDKQKEASEVITKMADDIAYLKKDEMLISIPGYSTYTQIDTKDGKVEWRKLPREQNAATTIFAKTKKIDTTDIYEIAWSDGKRTESYYQKIIFFGTNIPVQIEDMENNYDCFFRSPIIVNSSAFKGKDRVTCRPISQIRLLERIINSPYSCLNLAIDLKNKGEENNYSLTEEDELLAHEEYKTIAHKKIEIIENEINQKEEEINNLQKKVLILKTEKLDTISDLNFQDENMSQEKTLKKAY